MKNNLHYFKISQENKEPHLDQDYFILEKHPELKKYLSGIKEIKEILITIKKLTNSKENKSIIDKYFLELFEIFKNNFSNCSELGCFVNACDTTRDLIQKDFESFKRITSLFIKKRKLDDKVPENWVQAIIDSNSSRKKGDLGERKIINFLIKQGYKEVKEWNNFKKFNKCVARFSAEDFSTKNVRKILDLKIRTKKQDKQLDLLIKNGKKVFLLEAKHLNTGGGEQDKQISELIEIISLPQERDDIFYVSFLDGTYSNLLLDKINKSAKKRLKQRKEIEKYLMKNPNNFWVNTAGFES
ncbi:MAG: hypothetical protein ABIA02_00500, partial [Candidatus Falkowbacteria bacterium]